MFISPSYLKDSLLGIEFSIESSFLLALLPIEILVKAENNMDNSHETATRPTVVENNNSQNSSSSTNFPTNSGECEKIHITNSTI